MLKLKIIIKLNKMNRKLKLIAIYTFIALFFSITVYHAQSVSASDYSIDNPLKGVANTPQEFIGQIIKGVLGIVGSLALVMFIYGGFTWMTSSGNSEQVTKGKNIVIWAAIGLIVIFSSYTLIRFLLGDVLGLNL
jgi:hypothetical protein